MISTSCRALSPAAALLAATLTVHAQQQPPQAPPPQAQPQGQANPFCGRLEAQLQAFDRSGNDAGRADQLRKFEEAAAKQQAEVDRQEMVAQRAGCEKNSFFVLFSSNQATCGPLTKKIQQMRDNLDRIQADIERLRGDPAPEREGQRRAIVVALAQNNCGQQYQQQVAATPPARSGGLFETLFGPKSGFTPGEGSSPDAPNWPPGQAAPSAPSACGPATDSIIRFRLPPRRPALPRTKRRAGSPARPPRCSSIPTAIPERR